MKIKNIREKPLEFLLDGRLATQSERNTRLHGIKSLPNEDLITVGDELYLVDERTYCGKGIDSRPTLYRLSKRVA